MDAALCDALEFLGERISAGVPRRVSTAAHRTLYVLIDASFDEDKSGGLGGVLFDTKSKCKEFSTMLDTKQVQRLIHDDAQVVIGELEALAPVMALDLWKSYSRSYHVIFYIDNDGARYGLLRGYSCSVSFSVLSHMMAVRLEELVCLQWFARVASSSNLADFPSRGNLILCCRNH